MLAGYQLNDSTDYNSSVWNRWKVTKKRKNDTLIHWAVYICYVNNNMITASAAQQKAL